MRIGKSPCSRKPPPKRRARLRSPEEAKEWLEVGVVTGICGLAEDFFRCWGWLGSAAESLLPLCTLPRNHPSGKLRLIDHSLPKLRSKKFPRAPAVSNGRTLAGVPPWHTCRKLLAPAVLSLTTTLTA